MQQAHIILSDWWRATSGEPAKANAGPDAAREIEQRYGVALPEDFRAYLIEGAPQADFWDCGRTIWWSPARLKNIPDEYKHPVSSVDIAEQAHPYIVFAADMIWCRAWAICCDDGPNRGKIALFGGIPDRFVASSFGAFVTASIADPLSVC